MSNWPFDFVLVAVHHGNDARWRDDPDYRHDVKANLASVLGSDEPVGEFEGWLWSREGERVAETILVLDRVYPNDYCLDNARRLVSTTSLPPVSLLIEGGRVSIEPV